MRIVKVGESYICPVCGKYTFEYAGDFDICPVCNWEDDLCQLENPDEEDCANHLGHSNLDLWEKFSLHIRLFSLGVSFLIVWHTV